MYENEKKMYEKCNSSSIRVEYYLCLFLSMYYVYLIRREQLIDCQFFTEQCSIPIPPSFLIFVT